MSEVEHTRRRLAEMNEALSEITDQYHIEKQGFFNFKFIKNETGETVVEYADIYRMMIYMDGIMFFEKQLKSRGNK